MPLSRLPPIRALHMIILSTMTTLALVGVAAMQPADPDTALLAPLGVQRDEALYENCRKDAHAACVRELQRLNQARDDYALTWLENGERDPQKMLEPDSSLTLRTVITR